jgi:hypothetical protein
MRRVIVGILWGSVYLQACGEKTETVDILDIDDETMDSQKMMAIATILMPISIQMPRKCVTI